MANVSGGLLAGETCRAGALGFLAAGHNTSLDDFEEQVKLFHKHAPEDAPLSIGFIGHSAFASLASWDRFEQVLSTYKPRVVQFFAPSIATRDTDEKTNVQVAHEYDCQVLAQVGNIEEGKQALEAGVDGLIAQGSEAGGHGLRREHGNGTLALAARLVSLTRETSIPVLAAGGIVDGRGVAAALALGCGGVVLGTRLWASNEALGPSAFKEQLTSPTSEPDQVIRTTAIDHIVNTYSATPWPVPYDSVGMIYNETVSKWDGKRTELEAALASDSDLASSYRQATSDGDPTISAVYSGEGVGEIDAIENVYDIIKRVNEEAIGVVKSMPQLLND